MLEIVRMKEENREELLEMVRRFYDSSAVSHAVSTCVLERTFNSAIAGNEGLDGYMLMDEGKTAGFAYVTEYYACEVGGRCVMIEEIYLNESCRGKGYATEFFQWVFRKYAHAKRFRLEVTMENEGGIRLYKRLGFHFLDYGQMVRDVL